MFEWRGLPVVRPVRKFIQRGIRGWSDEDVWGFDTYINRITAEGLLRLAETSHGYPNEFANLEEWQKYLRSMANDMLGWNEQTFCEEDAFDKAQGAWLSWALLFGGFWE